jgi:predicted GNAT family N-acyltransferase
MDVRIATWEEDYDLIRLVRITVFCQEQSIPQELDFDGLDPECRHVLAFTNSGEPIGTARMQKDGHLGRIAVLKEWRKHGVGKALVESLIGVAKAKGLPQVYLNAQVHAVPFYEELGFRAEGQAFLEAGIEHYRMTRKFAVGDSIRIQAFE